MKRMRTNQAIAAAIADEMRSDESVIMFGEDIAAAGGPFQTSAGLQEEFGIERVRDTPISEMAFMGAGVGAAMFGMRPIVEIMFMEFLGVALDQLVTGAAKMRYLSGGEYHVPLTVRASVGVGTGFGTQHSQTLENWVTATPGLKVVSPSDQQTAYGLLRAAIRDDDPVIVLEPRVLYGTRGDVNLGVEGIVPIGEARVRRPGKQVTVVAMGRTVSVAQQAAEELAKTGVEVEVIDLLTLVPWDTNTVLESVTRTGRLVVLEDSPETGGWGSIIVSKVTSEIFSDLRAAPLRICAPDIPVPYGKALEARFAPHPAETVELISKYLQADAPPQQWWQREKLTYS